MTPVEPTIVFFLSLMYYLPTGEASGGVVKQPYESQSECQEALPRKIAAGASFFHEIAGFCLPMPKRGSTKELEHMPTIPDPETVFVPPQPASAPEPPSN